MCLRKSVLEEVTAKFFRWKKLVLCLSWRQVLSESFRSWKKEANDYLIIQITCGEAICLAK